ncbi:MAG: hypothetical protein KDD51_06190 [Bdellovibrionales bacterium]|nr:hypothetical protein [Bdellovibrionales bacterium]
MRTLILDSRRFFSVLFVATALIGVVLFGFACQKGGFLDVESQAFLLNYTSGKTLLERIFDVARNDWNCYQARELSYAVDLLDAKFIQASAAIGVLHFLSLSHYLLLFAIGWLHFFFMKRHFPQVPLWASLGLLLAYFTTPSSMIASFFRSSKILVGFFLYVLLWLSFLESASWDWRKQNWKRLALSLLGMFVLFLLMTLADRQGFFFCCALALVFGAAAWLYREPRWGWLCAVALTASALNTIYNLYLGPALIFSINGYYPDFSFQNMRFLYSFEGLSARTIAARMIKSLLLLGETVSYYFGSIGTFWGLGLMGGVLVYLFKKGNVREGWISLLGMGLIVVMALILVFRAPYLLWVEHKLVYYWIPTNSLLLFGTSVLVGDLLKRKLISGSVAAYFLGVTVLLNLVQLPLHYQSYTSAESHFAASSRAAAELRECIRQTELPLEAFGLTQRERSVCGKLRG